MSLRLLLALLLAPAAMQAAYPDFTGTKPNGGQRGSDLKLTLQGARLADFEDLMFFNPGFKVKSVESRAANAVELTLSIAPDAPLGNQLVRIRTKSGISHTRQFMVSPFPNVAEKEPNNDFATAQPIELNQTIEGVVLPEDVDYYKLTVKKGQRISVEIDGLRLAYGVFDPYIAIIDKDKFEKAFSDDTILHRQDGYCSYVADYDGDYYVMVRESSYRGSGRSFYRLHVGSFSRPDAVYPAGGRPGTKLQVRFVDSKDSFTEEVTLPKGNDPDFQLYSTTRQPAPSGNPFRLSNLDNTLEVEPNDSAATATVAAPADSYALNGVIDKAGDVDFFKVQLKKGQVLDCRCYAQAIGSPLDPVVNVLNTKGRTFVGNDDGGGLRRLDSRFKLTVPADGEYIVTVRDHLERGGPNFVYRLEMIASLPSMTFASPDYTVNDTNYRQFFAVPRGGRMVLLENFSRNGVGGDYRFDVQGLPAGMKLLTTDPIPGDMPNAPLMFEAAADAPLGQAVVPVTMLPLDPKNTILGEQRQVYDIVRDGNTIYYQGIENKLPFAVVEEAPYSLEIAKVDVPVVQNGIYNLRVVAKRKDGFKAPIRVFMVWLPPGISSLGEQTIPENGNECVFQLNANGGVPTKTWKFVVMGEADAGAGRVYNASPFSELTTELAYVSAPAIPLTAMEQGQNGLMVTPFEVTRPFEGEATATLVGVPDTFSIAPIKITKDTKELRFTVVTTDKTPIGKKENLFVQVEVPVGKSFTTHRVALGSILRVDAPRKASSAPVAKAAPAAGKPAADAAKPAAPVVLSRLEQLRQKNDAPKN
jgi:hypothetical protein